MKVFNDQLFYYQCQFLLEKNQRIQVNLLLNQYQLKANKLFQQYSNLKQLNQTFGCFCIISILTQQNNLLKSGKDFAYFQNLETLIIDNNYYFNLNDFPQLPQLVTLSANKNNFNNLEIFVEDCVSKFPKLTHLSLIKNPFCPMFIGEEQYQTYRSTLIKQIRNLKNIDGVLVDPKEVDPNYFKQQKYQLQQQQQQQLNNHDESKGTIYFNQKYSQPNPKIIKQRSEGNRFVKNNQL